ncbi:YciI family protein [Hellea balneolensis]|uniref:YciI family protein n=1 Tax=Hellea balneolensis TaxID=287478 RepID=UPI0003F5A003|nr:YciI family protein [Hellea balneolensis]
MEFIVYSADKPDGLHIRQSARDAHLAWLKAPSEIKPLVAGPWLDDEGVMRGSLLIVEAKDKQAVLDWLSGDPYKTAGLTASVDVKAYKWVIGKP